MQENLILYENFHTDGLARQLHESTLQNAELLRDRNLLGVIKRYGSDMETARQSVIRGQYQDNPIHLAIVNEAGNVVGAASIYDSLKLIKQRMPIPARLAIGPLSVEYSFANPNISAWARYGDELSLIQAYRLLAEFSESTKMLSVPHEAAWTIEPVKSPRFIHESIAIAGLERVATRRFSDEETRHTPPRSRLYAALSGHWITSIGKLKELRTGEWHNRH